MLILETEKKNLSSSHILTKNCCVKLSPCQSEIFQKLPPPPIFIYDYVNINIKIYPYIFIIQIKREEEEKIAREKSESEKKNIIYFFW